MVAIAVTIPSCSHGDTMVSTFINTAYVTGSAKTLCSRILHIFTKTVIKQQYFLISL